jgi:hypothetical protein
LMPLLSAVTREPASCGGPSLFNARALLGHGDPQVASQADHVRHRHLRRATHPPLAQYLWPALFDSSRDCMLLQHTTMDWPDLSRAFGQPPGSSTSGASAVRQLFRNPSLARAQVRVLDGHTRCLACLMRYSCCPTLASGVLGGSLSSEVRVRSSFSWTWRL